MEYSNLGKTGLTVSRLGLGGAPIGGDFGDVSDQQAIDVIHTAIDLGINFFDTAPLYGRGESERRYGIALKGKRERVVLATKAVMRGDPYTYENTISSVESSLHRLQTDYIDLIQLHEAEHVPFEIAMNGTIAAFLKLKEQGKVRAIGVNAGRLELLFPFIKTGEIDTVQTFSKYTLLDHTAKDILFPLAKEAGVGIINGSPLGMGVLTDKPAPFLQKNEKLLKEAKKRKEQLSFLKKTGPNGLIEPAMRFSLSCPDIAVTLSGTTSLRSLKLNASYCDGKGLGTEELKKVYELFENKPLFSY